ncbi:hypothetical protein [Brachybacterium sp. UNK5269]|uniref:hypothetical protein n=1 Tax=Brachybacterium sp. UNK5269 TaxID=3408576 RepID=UPI003BB17E5D
MEHLRILPPPGVDAAEYRRAVEATDVAAAASGGRLAAARESIGDAADGAASGLMGTARGARGAAGSAGERAATRPEPDREGPEG